MLSFRKLVYQERVAIYCAGLWNSPAALFKNLRKKILQRFLQFIINLLTILVVSSIPVRKANHSAKRELKLTAILDT